MNARATRVRLGLPVAIALVCAVVCPSVGAATINPAQEGYDLMRQITTQQVHPAVLIVLDRSGSLTFPAAASPTTACSGDPPSNYNLCWSYDSGNNGYVWWGFSYKNTSDGWTMAGAVPSAGDFTVSLGSTSFMPRSGAGNGYWVRAGQDQVWSGLIASSSYKTRLYINGNPGWAKGTQVTISGAPSSGDNGTYYTCAAMATDGNSGYASGLYYYATVSSTYSSGSCGTIKSFASTPYPVWLQVQKVGTTAGQSLWYFMLPSRMPIIKNALGNSMTIYEPSVGSPGNDLNGNPFYLFPGSGGPVGGAYFDWYTKSWVNWAPTTAPPAGDPTYTTVYAPADLVGNTSSSVDWGLVYFYGNSVATTVNVNPDDNNQATSVTAIEGALAPIGSGGLKPYDGTPTSMGLDYAKASTTTTWSTDTKKTCGRLYATILVTDGESNTCNPSGGSWGSSCTNYSSNWDSYPPGRTDELFLQTTDGGSACSAYKTSTSPTDVQSFAIGVSPDVARCELNLDAYFGRTDASAGTNVVKWQGSGRLPQNTSGTTSLSNYNPATGDYAFFANNITGLSAAFDTIVASLGIGDYTTSAPSTSSAPSLAPPGAKGFEQVGLISAEGYPGFRGHLYAYDLFRPTGLPAPSNYPLYWDAGDVLSNRANNTQPRAIYTWDPSKLGTGANPLIQIQITGNKPKDNALASQLNALCGSCGITTNVVDYVVGNDGTLGGIARAWKLGSITNSTPAIIGPPEPWLQTTLPHPTFEGEQATRHSLVWIGSDDGMVHAVDLVDGAEIIALMPPDQLGKQPGFYQQYSLKPTDCPTGEPILAAKHVYGVANSMRFADVWAANDASTWPCDKTDSAGGCFKTLLFITEGPGGTGLHAIDVTHPYPGRSGVTVPPVYPTPTPGATPTAGPTPSPSPTVCPVPTATPIPTPTPGATPTATPNPTPTLQTYAADSYYSSSLPVLPLWGYTADGAGSTAVLSALAKTWSVPAVGMVDNAGTWQLIVGAGYNDAEDATSNPPPKLIRINPATGSISGAIYGTQSVTPAAPAYVRNQTFADDVVIQKDADLYKPDNKVSQGIQLDLHGQVWLLDGGSSWSATSLSGLTGLAGNPLYFSPAVANYPSSKPSQYDLYAFASGSFYEKSPNVTGPNVGTSGNFQPSIYLVSRSVLTGTASIKQIPLAGLSDGCYTLSSATQMTSYPQILVPQFGKTGDAIGLFTAYDPKAGTCVGNAYLIFVYFDPVTLSYTATAYSGGAGASPGWVITSTGADFSKSWIGQNGKAYFPPQPRPIPIPPPGGAGGAVNWWVELQ